MLNFLNNQQNRKDHPNENFGKGNGTLYLGRGNYSEHDIKRLPGLFPQDGDCNYKISLSENFSMISAANRIRPYQEL